MARGKNLSLEEARKADQLEQFAKEHPFEGDWNRFDDALGRMARKPALADQTSTRRPSEDCGETQTRPGTSEDVSG